MNRRLFLRSRRSWNQPGIFKNLLALHLFWWMCSVMVYGVTEDTNERSDNRVIQLETYVIDGDDGVSDGQLIDHQSLNLQKIVDLSEVISSELIEASMVRKSGYGNEINLRGFSQANLPVIINGGLIEGACGSRKDPSLSHINLLTVDRLIVREGPFDVTQPGNLGGFINVLTKAPISGFSGEILMRTGSYDFYSSGLTATGGNGRIQFRLGYNYSESGQFEDGNGNALWELRSGRSGSYNAAGQSAKAFSKKDIWGALKIDFSAKQSLELNYSWGDARDILTSRVAFDTEKELTRLMNLKWTLDQLGSFSDHLEIRFYRNDVGHYPTQEFRNVSVPKSVISKTNLSGFKIQNTKQLGNTELLFGLDLTRRKWNADVYNAQTCALLNGIMIPLTKNEDWGLFVRTERDYERWSWNAGLRFDRNESEADAPLTFVERHSITNMNRDSLLGGFATFRYHTDRMGEFYTGVGRSYRVPNGSERYIQGSPRFFGNPELEPTANTEFDLGWSKSGEHWRVNAKAFYSDLKDYIYQVFTLDKLQTYENIDAHILGGDISGSWFFDSGFSTDAAVAIHRGKKDSLLDNNNDPDLGKWLP